MFKKGQVVALDINSEEIMESQSQYQKIVRIVGDKVYLSEDDSNDPRLFYYIQEIRPLTKEEIEGA